MGATMENSPMNNINKNDITPLEELCLKAVRTISWITIFVYYPKRVAKIVYIFYIVYILIEKSWYYPKEDEYLIKKIEAEAKDQRKSKSSVMLSIFEKHFEKEKN